MRDTDKLLASRFGKVDRSASLESYAKVLERVFKDVLDEHKELDRQRSGVAQLLSELMDLPATQRRLVVLNSARYQTWPLVEELLGECRKVWSDDPVKGEVLADTAREIAECLKLEGFRQQLLCDLKAEIWSHIANCRRNRSDLHGAQIAFEEADRYLRRGSGDPMEKARYLDLRSSLLRAQRRFSAAEEALNQAIRIYRSSRDRHSEGRAQIKQAKLFADSGRPCEAIRLLEFAGQNIDGQREPRLLLMLSWNLAYLLAEVGKPEEARLLLPRVRNLVRQFGGKLDRLRVLWVEGTIRGALGQAELALEALNQVREGFIAAGFGYDVALVSLDMAAIYLENGHTADVRRMAAETLPLVASLNVQRELLMAWQLFKQAAERDIATLRLIDEVTTQVRNCQSTPAAP